jgi:hypothetical protein
MCPLRPIHTSRLHGPGLLMPLLDSNRLSPVALLALVASGLVSSPTPQDAIISFVRL